MCHAIEIVMLRNLTADDGDITVSVSCKVTDPQVDLMASCSHAHAIAKSDNSPHFA